MRKLLAVTSCLSLVGSAAVAEVTISGDAKLGLDYDSQPKEAEKADETTPAKHVFRHDMGVKFSVAGTTDFGLAFGGEAGFDSKTGGGSTDEGKVFVSGAWGTLTIGSNDAADLAAGGIEDVGLFDIGVDDVAESLRGQTASSIRFDNTFGQVTVAISAGSKAGTLAVEAVDADDLPIRHVAATVYDYMDDYEGYSETGICPDPPDPEEIFPSRYQDSEGGGRLLSPVGGAGGVAALDWCYDSTHGEVFAGPAIGSYLIVPIRDGTTSEGSPGTKAENEFAVGMQFDAGSMNFGVGYAAGGNDVNTTSLSVGYATGEISGSLFWSSNSEMKTAPSLRGTTGRDAYIPGTDDPDTWWDESAVLYNSGIPGSDPLPESGPGHLYGYNDKVIEAWLPKHSVDPKDHTEKRTTIGMDLHYSIGNSTLTLSYARLDIKNEAYEVKGSGTMEQLQKADNQRYLSYEDDPNPGQGDQVVSKEEIEFYNVRNPEMGEITMSEYGFRNVSHSAFGIGIAHDLGGGASVNAGFGSLPNDFSSGEDLSKKSKASLGFKFAF